MPNQFNFSPYSAEQAEIERQQALAKALQAQSDPAPAGQMVGNQFVKTSPLLHLANALKGVSGSMWADQAKKQAMALQDRMGTDRQTAMAEALRLGLGTPAQPEMTSPGAEIMGNTNDIPGQAAVPGNPLAAYSRLTQSQDPMLQQMGFTGALSQLQPKAPIKVGAGDVLLDPNTLQPRYTAPPKQEPFSLAPGATRYDASGKPIVSAPATDKGVWSEPYEMGGAQVQRNSVTGEIRTAVSRPPVTNVTTNNLPPQRTFENENKLRDDYTAASKSFVNIRDAYDTVNAALSGDISAPSTLAGATKFMKMLDPESVVRESELNMALKSTGMLDRFLNLHNIVMKGQVLTPSQVTEIKRIAGALYNTAKEKQTRTDEYFGGLAKQYGLSPERVIRNQLSASDRRDEPRGGSQAMYAVNPTTKERIMSMDGGKTWGPAK